VLHKVVHLNERVCRWFEAAITENAFAINRIGDWEGEELPFQQNSCQTALVLTVERNCRFFCAGGALQSWIVKKDSIALAAFHHEKRRPLLVETSAFAIDKTCYRLHLSPCCGEPPGRG